MNIDIIPRKKEYEVFLNNFPPDMANKFLPEWYKKQKRVMSNDNFYNYHHEKDVAGAKSCPAIQDLVTTGIVIPLWSSFYFTTLDDGQQRWEFLAPDVVDEKYEVHVGHHPDLQVGDLDLGKTSDGSVLKLTMPYWFLIPDGYDLLYTDPFYHFRNDIRCLSGIVQGDKWGTISMVFEILNDNFSIQAGEPILHVYPVKRQEEKLNINTRKGTEEEYEMVKNKIAYMGATRTGYKNLKSNEYYNK